VVVLGYHKLVTLAECGCFPIKYDVILMIYNVLEIKGKGY